MCTSAPALTSSLTQWENPCQDTSCSAVLPSSNTHYTQYSHHKLLPLYQPLWMMRVLSLCPAGPQHSLPGREQPRRHCSPPWRLGAGPSAGPGTGLMTEAPGRLPAHSSPLIHKEYSMCMHTSPNGRFSCVWYFQSCYKWVQHSPKSRTVTVSSLPLITCLTCFRDLN